MSGDKFGVLYRSPERVLSAIQPIFCYGTPKFNGFSGKAAD